MGLIFPDALALGAATGTPAAFRIACAVTCAVNYDVSDDVSDDEPPTRWLFFVSAAMKMTRLELA